MAKTPLLSSIKRLFQDFRTARAHGMTLEQLKDARAEATLRAAPKNARRDFLAAAGAGALALALPRSAMAGKGADIAIVGGGIAGLTCALKLADRGIASTVYEASGRLGGRMFSNASYWNQSQVSEWCGELIDTGHVTIQKLAKRFKLDLDDLHGAEPAGSEDTYRFFDDYYRQSQANADFAPVFDAVTADADAAGYPTTFDSFTAAGLDLDQMSVYDWIEARVPGGHDSPFGQLLDVAYNIEYGAETDDQASLNLVYLLGFQPTQDGDPLYIFGESDETFHIRGGNQRLPLAIANSLGNAVKTGHSLTRIKQTAAGRYKLSFDRTGQSSIDVTVDYVVLAIPFAVLRGIDYSGAGFDALKDEAIQDLGRAHNGKTQLQFTSRHWNHTGAWPGVSNGSSYSDTGYQAGWDVTRAQPGAQGIMVFYSGGDVTNAMLCKKDFVTGTDKGARDDAANALLRAEPVFPGLSARYTGKTTQSLPHKSPYFNASYSYWKVGQYTAFSGYEGAPQGGVLFCGEHTSQDFQGFMEGGASTGKHTARQLAKLVTGKDDFDDSI